MSKKMWMIRAGRSAILVQDFEEQGYVGVGWKQLNDLSEVKTKEDLEKLFRVRYPEFSGAKFRMQFGQIARFRFEIQKGDYAITYNPEYRHYPVGRIVSDYQYVPDSPGGHNHIKGSSLLLTLA